MTSKAVTLLLAVVVLVILSIEDVASFTVARIPVAVQRAGNAPQQRRFSAMKVLRSWPFDEDSISDEDDDTDEDDDELAQVNSEMCRGRGTYISGACSCNEGYYGRRCECYGLSSDDHDAACRMPNSTLVCQGNGQCICGTCECNRITTYGDPFLIYSGQYCQCNDYMCDYYEGEICGGPGRGRCVCGVCRCHEGYVGRACSCRKSNDTCYTSKGILCNGVGKCICGKCECAGYSNCKGPTCEDCPVAKKDDNDDDEDRLKLKNKTVAATRRISAKRDEDESDDDDTDDDDTKA